ncbi:MAG: hypothetical protein HC856_00520 [Pseudanabaena sp. RU_4_16]|nr:hypothetical protein [Pseudanabaena sp. SU_2_4]NJM27119.1 hypothetical protein [Pseudanabaena sp. RU_4_16]
MAKQRFPKFQLGRSEPISQAGFQAQLKSLLHQQKYRQALDEIQKIKRAQPDLTFTPAEAEIWLLRGKQEFQKKDFKQAETSLQRSLELGGVGEAHYWLAKCLLERNQIDRRSL